MHKARAKFVKDYKLPIQVVQDPYFKYFLDIYDPYYQSKEKHELFEYTVQILGGYAQFIAYFGKLRNTVVDHVKHKKSYQDFNSPTNGYIFMDYKPDIPTNNLYKDYNTGKPLISVDLVKAGFQALSLCSAGDIVDNCASYEEFISQFTDIPYFIKSKQVRQTIFGNLNCKRQNTVFRQFIMELHGRLQKFDEYSPVTIYGDELIFEYNGVIELHLDSILSSSMASLDFRKEKFTLDKIKGTKFFRKYNDEDVFKSRLQCVPVNIFAQIFKHVFGGKFFDEFDMVFYHEEQVARFLKPYMEGR
jgi:hypothetical protein